MGDHYVSKIMIFLPHGIIKIQILIHLTVSIHLSSLGEQKPCLIKTDVGSKTERKIQVRLN